jgi:DNA integrity scanning protein DisA with diadenylate cyclase activity
LFKEHEVRYLVASAILVWVVLGLLALYEIYLIDDDSGLETLLAVIQWAGSSVAVTVIIIATSEVIMLAARINRKRFNEGLEKGREEGRERYDKAFSQCGVEQDGKRVLIVTEQILAYLKGETDDLPPPGQS